MPVPGIRRDVPAEASYLSHPVALGFLFNLRRPFPRLIRSRGNVPAAVIHTGILDLRAAVTADAVAVLEQRYVKTFSAVRASNGHRGCRGDSILLLDIIGKIVFRESSFQPANQQIVVGSGFHNNLDGALAKDGGHSARKDNLHIHAVLTRNFIHRRTNPGQIAACRRWREIEEVPGTGLAQVIVYVAFVVYDDTADHAEIFGMVLLKCRNARVGLRIVKPCRLNLDGRFHLGFRENGFQD